MNHDPSNNRCTIILLCTVGRHTTISHSTAVLYSFEARGSNRDASPNGRTLASRLLVEKRAKCCCTSPCPSIHREAVFSLHPSTTTAALSDTKMATQKGHRFSGWPPQRNLGAPVPPAPLTTRMKHRCVLFHKQHMAVPHACTLKSNSKN